MVRLFFVFRVFVNPVLGLGLGFGWEAWTRPGPCACCCFHQSLSSLLRLCCVRVRRCVSCCVFVSLSRDVVVGVGGGEDEFLWPICGREKWQQQQLLSVPL